MMKKKQNSMFKGSSFKQNHESKEVFVWQRSKEQEKIKLRIFQSNNL